MNKTEFLFSIEIIEPFFSEVEGVLRRKFAALQSLFSLSSFSVWNFQELCGFKVCYLASIFVLCSKKLKKTHKK